MSKRCFQIIVGLVFCSHSSSISSIQTLLRWRPCALFLLAQLLCTHSHVCMSSERVQQNYIPKANKSIEPPHKVYVCRSRCLVQNNERSPLLSGRLRRWSVLQLPQWAPRLACVYTRNNTASCMLFKGLKILPSIIIIILCTLSMFMILEYNEMTCIITTMIFYCMCACLLGALYRPGCIVIAWLCAMSHGSLMYSCNLNERWEDEHINSAEQHSWTHDYV